MVFGTKPLPKAMPIDCQLDPREQIQSNFDTTSVFSIQRNVIEEVVCEMLVILFWPQYAGETSFL